MPKTRVTSEVAYPLRWPDGDRRREGWRRKPAKFSTKFGKARDHLINELRLLGARYVVISTNVPTRLDGLPYAGMRQPGDPAVAVYFDYEHEQHVIACDKWKKVEDNIHAVGKTVEAIRGIERWGSGEMMKRAFSAFKALPPAGDDWRAVLGFGREVKVGPSMIRSRYIALASVAHPDGGGDEAEMTRLNQARDAANRELGQ